MKHTFFGGVHPDDMKYLTADKAVEVLPPPAQVVIPMSMHIGAPCRPLVKAGDRVLLGQCIGAAEAEISAPIHASVSGEVVAVEPRPHPNGTKMLSVVIRNDGKDACDPAVASRGGEPTGAAVLAMLRDRGVTGMGGASFPTQVKLDSAIGKAELLIVNGSECEPYITADCRALVEHTREIVDGVELAMRATGVQRAVFAIEVNKPEAIAAVRAAIAARGGADIDVLPMEVKYPQGSDRQLIQTVTGRQMPPGGRQTSVGCSIVNVFTAYCIHRAVREGRPAIERIVTVSGPAVREPKNLLVRVGTPIRELFAACGGFTGKPGRVILGGPMMGTAQHSLDVPVVKGTNAALAFEGVGAVERDPTCIRCGRCVDVCPMHLMPLYMYQYERRNDLDALERMHVTDCVECGACSYACPGKLHLTQSFRTAKAKLRERGGPGHGHGAPEELPSAPGKREEPPRKTAPAAAQAIPVGAR